jgi:ketosteroid isomerase-like protein
VKRTSHRFSCAVRLSLARIIGILALATAVAFMAPRSVAGPPSDDIAAMVRQLEDELTAAFNKYDAATLDRLWDDDLTFVFPNGAVAGKAERLAGLKEIPAEIPQSTNESVHVKGFGDVSVAIVVSKWPSVRDGKPSILRFRATHVWVKRGEKWRLVSAHVSVVKE